MPTKHISRMWHALSRVPSIAAELPSSVAVCIWSLLACIDMDVMHPPRSWIMPMIGFVIGAFCIIAALRRNAVPYRCCGQVPLSVFWCVLLITTVVNRGLMPYIAAYFGLAFVSVYAAADLLAVIAIQRHSAGEWLPKNITAVIAAKDA